MKRKDYLQHYWRWWLLGLAGLLLLLGSFLRVNAQTSKLSITITGAESMFSPALGQPMKLLQAIKITSKEIQKQLTQRPHISVAGDGVVQNLSFVPLAGTKGARPAPSSIYVAGDGIVRNVGLAAPKAP